MLNVLTLGAVNDGLTDNTIVLQAALDSMQTTGGLLYFPAGRYLTGSLQIYSNTTIYLEAGATILASGDFVKYPVITEEMVPGFKRGTRRGIFFALNAENITIQGSGTIDGCGYHWWEKRHEGEPDTRRPRTIQFINVDRVTIEGIHIQNSPCWTVHPIHCNNVTIHNISIHNPYDSPNTDGINPESCSNVKISDCYVDVGDDCITIKSGLETDLFQKQYPCENITVTNCTFVHGHGGVVIGSEMSGGVRNMTVSNCVFRNTERGIRLKTRRKRGGFVEDIIINNVIMDNVIAGITMNEYYKCGSFEGNEELFTYEKRPITADTPKIKGVIISNVVMKNVRGAGIYMLGLPEQPIHKVKIINVDIDAVGSEAGEEVIAVFNLPYCHGDGVRLKNVKDVIISDLSMQVACKEIVLENAENTVINGKLVEL